MIGVEELARELREADPESKDVVQQALLSKLVHLINNRSCAVDCRQWARLAGPCCRAPCRLVIILIIPFHSAGCIVDFDARDEWYQLCILLTGLDM